MGENEPALINTVITIHNVHGELGYNKQLAIQCQQLLFSQPEHMMVTHYHKRCLSHVYTCDRKFSTHNNGSNTRVSTLE